MPEKPCRRRKGGFWVLDKRAFDAKAGRIARKKQAEQVLKSVFSAL